MRPALNLTTRRAASSHCLWQHCSSTQYIEQFFIQRSPPVARPSFKLFSRSTSTYALKEQEEDPVDHVTKLHPRIMNKDLSLDALLTFLSTYTLTHKEIFSTLRTALYNTTQYDSDKAWTIYEKMVQYEVDGYLKINHYGHLLCILKYGHSPPRLVQVIENMRQHKEITPTNYHYSQVLYAMSRHGLWKEACQLIQSIPQPRPNHYHSLVVATKNSRDLDIKVLESMVGVLLEGMTQKGILLDRVTRSTAVSLLAKYKQVDLIIEFLKAVDSVWKNANTREEQPYNLYMYTSLIAGCARQGDSEGAKKLYVEMKRSKIKPNQVTYTALMDAYGRAGDFTSAIRLMTSHQNQHRRICNSMLTSLVVNALRHDNLLVAENAMKFMTKKKIKLKETDGVLRAAILWLKTKQDVDFARKYFDELYAKDKRFVNSIMVNHLVKAYGRRRDKVNVIDVYKTRLSVPLAEEEARRKHYLIDALFHCRDIPAAIGVFISMRNQAMPDEITMAMVIKGLVLNNENDLAWKLFKTLQSNGKEPNLHAYTTILKSLSNRGSCKKKRASVNMDRLDPGLLKAAGIQFNNLDFHRSPVPITTEALNLFRRLTGFHQPNVYIYTTLISCFAKNNIYQAINVFEHMCSNEVNPTVETYTALLQGCAIFRNSDLAFKVFNHMCERKVEPNEITWRYFLKSLLRARVDTKHIDIVGELARNALKNKANIY
ncbi:hypothetical protein G6F37_002885 [Rhizopus arrhizus]|nr:hypothetical protein G6F38_003161 [Rhizopus arrhizus]KAG1161652.1 hypothetical protein G6F37_002885 [Rhizopus arrhizus]